MPTYLSAAQLRVIFLHTESTTFPYDTTSLETIIDWAEDEVGLLITTTTDATVLGILTGYKSAEYFYHGVIGGATSDGQSSFSIDGISVSQDSAGLIRASEYFKHKFEEILSLYIDGCDQTQPMDKAGIPSDIMQELKDILSGVSNAEDFSYRNLRVYRVR